MQTTYTRRSRGGSNRQGRSFSSSSTPRRGDSYQGRQHRAGSGHRGRQGGGRGGGGGRKLPSFDPSRFINTNPVDVTEEVYTSTHTFDTFGLSPQLVKIIGGMGLTIPTPIQDQIIPHILKGRDVIGLAETGTGKTAAFLIPLIEETLQNNNQQALILTPTRELALQIEGELRKLTPGLRIYSTTCVGGTSIHPQIRSLKRKNHFVIGTPGRILDLINRGQLRPEAMSSVVLDEADRMLDMGFIKDMREILAETPKDKKTLFFSATMTTDAKKIVNDFLNDPVSISVKKKDVTNSIEQNVIPYEQRTKFDTLTTLFENPELKRVLIFGSMKHSVEKLAQQLSTHKINSESIHGNKNHSQRQRALQRFKKGDVRVLVATDVAARGIHVDNVTHVINYDLPNTFEDYVHRIGRTGRGSNRGKALTFVPHK